MLLRRLMEHVKDQNWTVVWLDLVIVIIGVFMGIQVANWNDERRQRSMGVVILERLEADFVSIQAGASFRVERVESHIAAADKVMSQALAATLKDDLSGLREKLTAIGHITPVSSSPTLTQLVTNGEMSLIRSEPLRRALTEFEGTVSRHRIVNAAFANAKVSSMTELEEALVLAPESETTLPRRYGDYLGSLLESPQFLAAVGKARRLQQVDLIWQKRNLENATLVLEEIKRSRLAATGSLTS